MKITAIVQARMGSSRLPGKVLKELGEETALARVIRRLQRSTLIDELLVATTVSPADDAIVDECARICVPTFRGSELDVLDRYYRAAQISNTDIVVRITSDCPLIDPAVTDQTIRHFLEQSGDYCSNALLRTFPRGLDTEAMRFDVLERAWNEARFPHQREHVTPYIYEHPELFRICSFESSEDYGHYRWTLDTAKDLELLRTIYERFEGRDDFGWKEIVQLMEREPALAEINSGVQQKALQAI
jgi:spore coat polysaccharide biosynthesis protein SpsF